ncbi:MAG: D-alanine--D-alanine ligase [Candidatus Neomarinimicrobiota bacterium]
MIKKIGILTGGESSEREISFKTCKAVENACQDLGYGTVQLIFDGEANNLVQKLQGIDFVFIALHGGKGENGVIQGLLDSLDIPYNGSGVLASALGMEKSLTKQLARSYGIQTPEWKIFTDINKSKNYIPNEFPIVVKPSADGSTIGLSFVKNQAEIAEAVELADKYDGNILIENYIKGRELTVTIIGQKVFPIVEIIPKHRFYDYECKYEKGMSEYICPAELPNTLTNKIQSIALEVFNILQCIGYARADFLLDKNNNPWFLEINTLPGMTSTSLVPKSAMAAGISFNNLFQMIINESLKK